MFKAYGYLDRSAYSSTWVPVCLIVQAVICSSANAASANGQASATAIGEVTSQPSIIIVQTPGVVTSAPPISFLIPPSISSTPQAAAVSSMSRLTYITTPSVSSAGTVFGNVGSNGSSLASLIDVNDKGVVTFIVTGATATTGVSVQLPVASTDVSNEQAIAISSSLILPAQVISDGGRLAVELPRVLNTPSSDSVNLEVSYN